MKRPLGIAGYLLFLLVVGVGLAELGARLLFPGYADDDHYLEVAFSRLVNSEVVIDPQSGNYSDSLGFAFTPGAEMTFQSAEFAYTARMNSLGFRGEELRPRAEGEYRVMLVGDSMLWGVGVDAPDTVASIMTRRAGPDLAVFDFSTGGYDTVQELIVARTHIDATRPDHLVLGLFVGNDILANSMTYVNEDGNYRVSTKKRDQMKHELREWLGPLYHSIIFRILALRIYVPRIRYALAARDEVITDTYALIEEFRRLAADRGVAFSVAILYPQDAVRGGLIEAWSNSRAPGALIRRFAEDRGIAVIDMLDHMHTAAHARDYFFQRDGHPNRAGNSVIAEAILGEVLRRR